MDKSFVSNKLKRHGAGKLLRPALALAFLFGAAPCTNAWADPARSRHHGHHSHHAYHGHHGHGRTHVGIAFGAPLWAYGYGPGWYGDPFYDYRYARPLVVQAEPPVYIERGAQPSVSMWYFCSDPQGYYPYVKQCSTDWRAVVPGSVAR